MASFTFQKMHFDKVSKKFLLVTVCKALAIYPLAVANAILLLKHGHVGTAFLLAFFVGRTLWVKAQYISWQRLRAVITGSSESGFMEPWLANWLALDKTMLSSFTIFTAGYGHLSSPHLTTIGAVLAIATLLASVHSMADENAATHLGDHSRQFATAVLEKNLASSWRKDLALLRIWSHFHMGAEVAVTLALCTWVGVWVAICSFLPAVVARFYRMRMLFEGKSWLQMVSLFEDPLNLMTYPTSSIFGMPTLIAPGLDELGDEDEQYHNIGNQPVLPECFILLLRYMFSAILLCASAGTDCFQALLKITAPTVLYREDNGQAILQGCVLLFLLCSLPMHVICLASCLAARSEWRTGIKNPKLERSTRSFLTRFVPKVREVIHAQSADVEGYEVLA